MKKGWQIRKLGEICEIERGGSPRPIDSFLTKAPDGINWIKIGDTKNVNKYITKTEEKIRPEGAKRSRMVYEGDFILSNSMSFGRPYIMKTTGCIHDGWLVLRQPKVDQDYLYHVLGSDLVFSQFDRLAAGSTVRNLNIGLVKTVEIPVPPLSEQRRIVGILDEAFDGIATSKVNAEKNLQNARALFESYLQDVFSKRGEGWEEKKLGDLCKVIAGQSPEGKYYNTNGDGMPFYQGKKDFGEKFIGDPTTWTTQSTKIARNGDILMSVRAPVGPVNFATSEICIGRGLAAIRSGTELHRDFLFYQLLNMQSEITGTEGAVFASINKSDIESLTISFAPLSEQQRIVNKLDVLTKETQHLESIYQQKLVALDELKKSLLDQAFSDGL